MCHAEPYIFIYIKGRNSEDSAIEGGEVRSDFLFLKNKQRKELFALTKDRVGIIFA
jgi:hypothetical protein